MIRSMITFLSVVLISSSCSTIQHKEKMDSTNNSVSVKLQNSGAIWIKNPTGKIKLYAIAANIADVPATLIAEKSFTQNELPFEIKLDLPKNHYKLIKPAVNQTDPIKYYIALDWDSNGDGTVGKGDVAIDFNKKFPTVFPGNSNEVFVLQAD